MARTTSSIGTQQNPFLDLSRNRLRLPIELLPEVLRQASGEGLVSPLAAVRLESGGVLIDGELESAAAEMFRVIAAASMMVTIDVQRAGDASVTTIWATPSRAVITSTLDPAMVDIEPVRLGRLPETLSDTILLERTAVSNSEAITVPIEVLAEAERWRNSADEARAVLEVAGFQGDNIDRLLSFQSPMTRRWRISSTWTSDRGQQMAELRGLDAGSFGQWLMEMTGGPNQPGEMTFIPQGDGDTLRALREVLPRFWVGTALNPRSSAS